MGLNLLVVAILINAALSAVSNCSWNSWMRDLVPQDRLGAFFSRRMSLSMGLGVVLSLAAALYIDYWKGQLPDFFAGRQLSLVLKWTTPGRELAFDTLNFHHWDFFFLFAFLIGLYCIHRLARVREVGEVEEEIVIHELITQVRRNMRNLSTFGGLRQMVNFPISVVYFPLSILNRLKQRKNTAQ